MGQAFDSIRFSWQKHETYYQFEQLPEQRSNGWHRTAGCMHDAILLYIHWSV